MGKEKKQEGKEGKGTWKSLDPHKVWDGPMPMSTSIIHVHRLDIKHKRVTS